MINISSRYKYNCDLESELNLAWGEGTIAYCKENGGKWWKIESNIWVEKSNENPSGTGSVDWPDITNKPATFTPSTHDHDTSYEAKNANIQAHIASPHAPSNAQKNSDITKAEITSKLLIGTDVLAPNGNGSSLTGLTSSQVGLGNANNTSDSAKPVSTATQTALDLKQDISSNKGGWTELKVLGSNATTTGQVLVDITGLVSGALSNSTKYEIEAILDCTTTAVTTGIQYAVATGGTGGASVLNVVLTGTTTSTAATSQTLNTAGTASSAMLTTSGSAGLIFIKGFVTTRGSGTANISLQHLKVTSGTSTVKIGSVLRYRLA